MIEFHSPDELYEAYHRGFQGCIPDPDDHDELLRELPRPHFATAAVALAGSGAGKLSLPFLSVLHFDPRSYEERQTTGDCVSHAARNAADLSRAVEIHVHGEAEGWWARGATEAIYGSRGHGGAGMTCSGAARFLHLTGGILLRKAYPFADLSEYRAKHGMTWGSQGLPQDVVQEAKQHPVGTVSQVSTIEDARDALANGYGLLVCSNFGFSNRRDADGFARRQGRWAHAMAWIGCDDASNRPGFLVQNSWGKWNDGPQRHAQPDGSFWIDYDTAAAMLRQLGGFAVSHVVGFPPQTLPDYGAKMFL